MAHLCTRKHRRQAFDKGVGKRHHGQGYNEYLSEILERRNLLFLFMDTL